MNLFKKKYKITLFILIILIPVISFSQEEKTNAQVLMEKFDKETSFPDGTIRGSWRRKKGNTIFVERSFRIYKIGNEFLYEIEKRKGEIGYKILCKPKESEIYFTKIPSKKIQKITLEERRGFQIEFGFSFEELCRLPVESNFMPQSLDEFQNKKEEYWKVKLSPIEKEGFSKIYIYLQKETNVPYRVDYFEEDGTLFRIGKFRASEIIKKDINGSSRKENRINLYTLTNLDTHMIYILELREILTDPIPAKEILKLNDFSRTKK